jgi:hypothetical protein
VAVASAASLVASIPTSASARPLYASDVLRVSGTVRAATLIVSVESLSDFKLRYRCIVDGGARSSLTRYAIRGRLDPHEEVKVRLPRLSRDLGDVRARCRAHVFDGADVLWNDGTIEVLARGSVDASGEPRVDLRFFNVTDGTVSFACTWRWGNPAASATETAALVAHTSEPLAAPGIDLDTVTDMQCAET